MKKFVTLGTGIALAFGCLLVSSSCSGGGSSVPSGGGDYPSFPDVPTADAKDFTLDYYPERGGYMIGDYRGKLASFAIPDEATVDGETYPIVGISPYALEGRAAFENIRLGNNFTRLDALSLHGCSSLKTLVVPSSVSVMDDGCLIGCENLEAISIPCAVSSLEMLFYRSYAEIDSLPSSLKAIAISEGETAFELSVYSKCENITSISLPSTLSEMTWTNPLAAFPSLHYAEYESCRYLGNANNPYQILINPVVENLDTLKIHPDCRGIADSAMAYNTSLQTVSFPTKLIHIGQQAFQGCAKLGEINLPEGLISVGGGAFAGCQNLTKVKVPDSLVSMDRGTFSGINRSLFTKYENGYYLGSDSNPHRFYIEPTVDSKSSSTWTPIIHSDCRLIAGSAFEDFKNLREVTIPDAVTYIGSGAFSECTALERASIGSGVKTMEQSIFYGCTSLSSVALPSSLTELPDSTFHDCTALRNVELPNGLTSIGDSAFWNTGLTQLSIPSSVREIGRTAFGKTYLTSLTLPNGIKVLKEGLFRDCGKLLSFSVPSSTTVLEDEVFSGCYSLQTVELPNKLGAIGTSAFSGCKALRPIVIPLAVEYIGASAFKSCAMTTIRCRTDSAGERWNTNWNPDNRPVVWNY